jgi:DNA modification methylase
MTLVPEGFTNKILLGDCLETLKQLPDSCVQCVVTSPPYFNQRDYGVDGQIGLERTPREFILKLVEVFREVRRILRADGVLWCVIGDSYARAGGPMTTEQKIMSGAGTGNNLSCPVRESTPPDGMKAKDLIGIPWMLAFALRDDGWYLRSDNIWHKLNPMPSSVTDRTTTAHEYVFMLSKNQKYFYDADAIKEPLSNGVDARIRREAKAGMAAKYNDGYAEVRGDRGVARRQKGSWEHFLAGKNKRSVWSVASEMLKDEHFAAFPQKLIEPCVLAGTSERGACVKCGAPWIRVVAKDGPQGHAARREHEDRRPQQPLPHL